jgi:predicted DNA-binding protein (MmcQ/YjbR family)
MARSKNDKGSALERLREFGLRYPGAHTKSPWPGHLDLAVNDKTFAYLSVAGDPPKISCKLPRSADAALGLPFTTPTAYGLGKSGWVTASFPDDASVPVEMLEEWIDESYRAQAPKRLSAKAPAHGAEGSTERRAAVEAAPRPAKKRPAPVRGKAPARQARAKKTRLPSSARAERAAAPTRAGKRARVSPRAVKRTPKKPA